MESQIRLSLSHPEVIEDSTISCSIGITIFDRIQGLHSMMMVLGQCIRRPQPKQLGDSPQLLLS